MPLSKIQLKPGINKEGTRYSAEEGWNDSDKVRFRKGLPEKIGGWKKLSDNTFQGIARSIRTWRTLASKLYIGIGTNLKFYIESGGTYNDITPIDQATGVVKATTSSSTTVTLKDNVGTIRTGMTVTGVPASATVKAATSGVVGVTLENNVGTIRVHMSVIGTDASGSAINTTVATVTDQFNIELAATKSLALGAALTFQDIADGVTVATVTNQGEITLSATESITADTCLHFQAVITLAANPIITTASSTTVRIIDTNGGYGNGDFVTFGGTITTVNVIAQADLKDKEFQIAYNDAIATAKADGSTGNPVTINTIDGAYSAIEIGMLMTGTDSSAAAVSERVTGVSGSGDSTEVTLAAGKNFTTDAVLTFAFSDSYTVTVGSTSGGTPATGGGSSVTATYQINSGDEIQIAESGYSAGSWGGGSYGTGLTSDSNIRLWSQANFGEDLILSARGGPLFYWDGDNALTTRATLLSSRVGALSVPAKANRILVSDISRFVFCFGTTEYLDTTYTLDPLLLRWSDQEDSGDWAPTTINNSGSLRLSRGGEIITAVQARQEILVWTDAALYNLQLLGGDGWGAQLVGENISIASPNAVAYANGIAFWMGRDKFYTYDGNVKPLPSSVHRHIFNDINNNQLQQITAGTNEAFNEVWWFYPKDGAEENDRYVVFNYLENLWYHGTDIKRSAWEDSGIRSAPIAATVTTKNIVEHEVGNDDDETAASVAITASITSGEFDIEDGNNMAFVWRMLPDLTFSGSDATAPSVTLTLNPLKSSGSGYNDPLSEGGSNSGAVTKSTTITVEPFTTQINTRIRGRQMALKVESTELGVKWQLGYPRIDMRPDGRR